MIKHISFIMDGNGRWAKEKGKPRNAGHTAGVDKAKEIILKVKEFGIPFISLYTFSKENWKRSQKEVAFLMGLIIKDFKRNFKFYIDNHIRIIHIGDRDGLTKEVLEAIDQVVDKTKNYRNPTVLLAFNYSGKYDITQAVNRIINDNKKNITEEDISQYLLTAQYPDPDLIVRTSGEFRISNYFLWQSAYSEFFISPDYWPDFTVEDLTQIIENFQNRDRRFGGVKDE